jgi:hypothetical protein
MSDPFHIDNCKTVLVNGVPCVQITIDLDKKYEPAPEPNIDADRLASIDKDKLADMLKLEAGWVRFTMKHFPGFTYEELKACVDRDERLTRIRTDAVAGDGEYWLSRVRVEYQHLLDNGDPEIVHWEQAKRDIMLMNCPTATPN